MQPKSKATKNAFRLATSSPPNDKVSGRKVGEKVNTGGEEEMVEGWFEILRQGEKGVHEG